MSARKVLLIAAAASATVGARCALGQARSDSFDLGTTYQTMEYFGASDAWYAQSVGGWSDSSKSAIADLLFSQTSGIGLSCWRFNLGGGIDPGITIPQRTADTFEVSQGVYDWTHGANERWFLGAAKARGVPDYLAFVNSPTRRMTKNGHTYADSTVGTTNLKTGYEGQFAKYMVDVLKHFRDNADVSQRVNFNYISPVNEPEWDWNGTTQEGNRYSVADIKGVTNALYTELGTQQVNSQILISEAGQIQDMYSGPGYVDAFAGDATVNTKLGNRLTYHSYWSDDPTTQLVQTRASLAAKLAQYPGWKAGESEYSILGSNGPGRDLTMTTALNVARVIHYDLTVAGSTAWTWWLAMSSANWKDGLIYLDMPTQTFQASKTLWAMGNYSRFVRPGAKRVAFAGDNTNVNGLIASAYRNDTTGDFDIVYVNEQTTAQAVSLNLTNATGFKSDYFTPYVTSDTPGDDLKAYPSVLLGDTYSVPAKSVVTLVGGTLNENNDGKVFAGLVGSNPFTLGGGIVTFNPGAGTYSGVLSGSGGFAKSGSGTMVLSGANTYSGETIVNGGVLKLGNVAALGSTAGGTTVNAGGTLDLNGFMPGNETITISGAGSSGQGALISTGADVYSTGVRKLVLGADATIGGTGRWNVRASGPFVVPVITGNNHNLTKVGTNEIWFTNCVLNNVGDITINGGKLGFENVLGGMGNAGNTVSVAAGATLGFWSTAATPVYTKQFVVSGGAIENAAGSTKLVGPVAVSGASVIDSGSETLTIDGALSGAGSITKQGSGTLELVQSSNYNGAVNVSAGSVLFGAPQSIGSLAISPNASASINAGNDSILVLGALSVSAGARLDLNDSDLIVNNGNFSALEALVFAGYSDVPDSSRAGIVSTAGQNSGGTTILALFDNAVGDSPITEWQGHTVNATAVIGKYTYFGDTDWDGQVTPQDFTAIDANLGATGLNPGIAWLYGDTDFDGNITPQDYTAVDASLGLGIGNPLSATGLAVVPEPAAISLGVVGILLTRRRRA